MTTPLHYYQPRKPLLATDGRPSAMAALTYAALFVKALSVPLQVVHYTAEAASGQEILEETPARLSTLGGIVSDRVVYREPRRSISYAPVQGR